MIGVLGVGGETTGDNTEAFRKAMAAPGESDEFKGTVANVFTHKYWPADIDAVLKKADTVKGEFAARSNEIKKRQKAGEDCKADIAKLAAEERGKIEASLTKDELFLLDNGKSNQGFHYYGSAKFFAQVGQAFAETLAAMRKNP